MTAKNIVMAAAGGSGGSGSDPLYVEDVFSTYLYTGNGSTQTITNGIDLAGKGGLVWIKSRSAAYNHFLTDTARGSGFPYPVLSTNTTAAQTPSGNGVYTFDSSGFAPASGDGVNQSTITYASWTFRKAPKFFDVVTYTGTGALNINISHALGVQPGLIIIKSTSASGEWVCYARAGADSYVIPNSVNSATFGLAQTNGGYVYTSATVNTYFTSTTFNPPGLSYVSDTNANGVSYVAYLFAHDTAADGLIQCGTFTTDGSGSASVTTLGWEPQFLMVKAVSTTGAWIMLDSMRGWNMSATDARLLANSTAAETTAAETGNPTATGFMFQGGSASATYIYMAIRRPNKPPTTAASVFGLNTDTATLHTVSAANSRPEMVDMVMFAARQFSSAPANNGNFQPYSIVDRARGLLTGDTGAGPIFTSPTLVTGNIGAELTTNGNIVQSNSNNTVVLVKNQSGIPTVSYALRRAPGFFDIVAYTGNGSTNTVNHNLGVAPEFVIIKNRSADSVWDAWTSNDWTKLLFLNLAGTGQSSGDRFPQNPSATSLFLSGSATDHNSSGSQYVAYLFATLPGISKVGSYTGNGSSQTINCGFTTGARFVLIKRTDAAGDWYVWDAARGIVAANDPHLSLNSAASEVTTNDSIDPDNSGFIVNQVAETNINVSGGKFIYLAIA